MRGNNLVAFQKVAQLPAWHDVRNAPILLHALNDDLGYELAISVHEQFAVGKQTLFFADVEHYEIPLRISHQDLATQTRRQHDGLLGADIAIQFVLQTLDLLAKDTILRFSAGKSRLQVLDFFAEGEDLLRVVARAREGGEFIPRGVPFLARLGQIGVEAVGPLRLPVGFRRRMGTPDRGVSASRKTTP